ncbi:MAG: sulfatase [Cytophagales bacterium]|nr:sulfatase [Cytophagales bacterium]
MKKIKLLTYTGIATLGVAALIALSGANNADSAKQPNVIVIYTDDLGWKELSYSGNTRLKTPNIDQLSAEGTRFTQAYSSAPICSPSRAGLVTGRYQQRFGFEYLTPLEQPIDPNNDPRKVYRKPVEKRVSVNEFDVDPEKFAKIKKGIPESELTFGEIFKNAGYATALIGKWHLGEVEGYFPDQNGFDYFFGCLNWGSLFGYEDDPTIVSSPAYYSDKLPASRTGSYRWVRGREEVIEKRYITDVLTDESIQFIEKNKNKPFFLYLPFTAVHDPLQAKKSDFDQITSVNDTNTRIQLAMTKSLDDNIGKLNDYLKKNGLDKNTLIFFSSDNGGPTYYRTVDNTPLKGGKLSHFEGGIRVPFFIKYPNVIPAGKVYDLPVSNLDIFATAVAAAGLKVPDGRQIDGVNLIPFVNGKNTARPHETLFWRNGYSKAARKGDWKLYVNDRNGVKYLYDLAKDPSETTDLSKVNTDKFKELEAELKNWESNLLDPKWPARRSTLLEVGKDLFFFPI